MMLFCLLTGKNKLHLQPVPFPLARTVLDTSWKYPKIAPGTKNAIKIIIIIVFYFRVIGCITLYV